MSNLTPTTQAAITPQDNLVSLWHAYLVRSVAQGDISQTTSSTYRTGLAKFMAWAQTSGIVSVMPKDVGDFKAAMLTNAKASSVNVWLSGVRAFYAWAVESGHMLMNPAAQIKGAKRKGANKTHKRDALTQTEAARLLALPLSPRDAAIIALKLYSGVRDVEVSRADLADLRTKDGSKVLFVHGKGHSDSDEFVKINARCEDVLATWLAARGYEIGALFTSDSDRNKGGRLSMPAIRALVKKAFKAAGINEPTKTSHSTRHTAITTAIKKGANPLQVQAMARHAKLDTTMIYFHESARLENPAEDFISYEGGK